MCAEGFFCPNGSVTATERECGGNAVYCPWGAAKPVPVDIGFYSTGGVSPQTRTGQVTSQD